MKNHFCFHVPQVATLSVSCEMQLPTFVGELARPEYVDNTVFAVIAEGQLSTGHFSYLILTRWIGAASEYKMQQWAYAYKFEVEKEAHELSYAENFNEAGYAANML